MQPTLIDFNIHGDDRGSLIALEQHKDIPFDVKRVYYIFDTKADVRRGFHAHKHLEQVAVCIKGACTFKLDDGKSQQHIRLDTPSRGLYIGNSVWREMYDFTENCVLLVMASNLYDESDYIRNYNDFITQVS